jgi:hypothetical protein
MLAQAEISCKRASHRGGILQVPDLKDHLHVWQQPDALIGWQCEQAAVVHHTVHGLDPVSIQVTIQQDPLGVVIRHVGQLTHGVGQQAVLHKRHMVFGE